MIKKEEDAIAAIDSKLNLFDDDEISKQQSIDFKKPHKEKIKEIETILKQASTLSAPFNWGLDFLDVITLRGGFDIVIANPPYGVKVTDEVRNEFCVESKDSYGVFTVLGLRILRPGGTLCYIMSDTWQTIKSHKELRENLLKETDAQYLISVPSDVFQATVNTGVYTFVKRKQPRKSFSEDAENWIFAADFSPLKINQNGRVDSSKLEVAFELLIEEKPVNTEDGYAIISDRDMAIYAYKQNLIPRFSNLSFFIASPNISKLLFDNEPTTSLAIEDREYEVRINSKTLKMVKLSDFGSAKKGLATGDNHHYFYKKESGHGNYSIYDPSKVLSNAEINNLTAKEKLKGIDPEKYNGKYLVPLDKGEESFVEESWLPNYYIENKFFIDWSKKTVTKLYKTGGMRNPTYQFKDGISFSWTGQYAPTFRISSGCVFDQSGSCIFQSKFSLFTLLAFLASKATKYLVKSVIDTSVNSTASVIEKIMILNHQRDKVLEGLVNQIVSQQKKNEYYDYITNEQLELDNYIYSLYNFNKSDILEIENWYFRRYPKLANAIEAKLKEKNK